MTNEINIEDLEKALLDRATALSREYSERARRSYAHFIEDENERLRLREEREVMAAKMQSEQVFRRMVQTEELLSIKQVDQLRWKLMSKVKNDVFQFLHQLTDNRQEYLNFLKTLLNNTIQNMPVKELVIEVNHNDRSWLAENWESLIDGLTNNQDLTLSENVCAATGGFLIYNKSYRVRVNNTFEGLMERYSEQINQIIAENLFAELTPIRDDVNGR
jgi:V/A-type H+-transporting ATPase subunit E